MREKVIGLFLLVLLVLPSVMAIATNININTLADHDVSIKVLDPFPKEDESNLLEIFEETSDSNGDVSVTTSRSNSGMISLWIMIKKDGKKIEVGGEFNHKFNNLAAGNNVDLSILDKPKEPIPAIPVCGNTGVEEGEECDDGNLIDGDGCSSTCVIEVESEEVVEGGVDVTVEVDEEFTEEAVIEELKSGGVTGLSLLQKGKQITTSKATYYVVGVIVILLLISFVLVKLKKNLKGKKGSTNFSVRSYDDFQSDNFENKILDAEKKIKEAEEDLEEVTSKSKKLREAKEKFEKDKADLDRLERE